MCDISQIINKALFRTVDKIAVFFVCVRVRVLNAITPWNEGLKGPLQVYLSIYHSSLFNYLLIVFAVGLLHIHFNFMNIQ